jgi:membrane-associated phospholipid phosphatase
MRELKPYLEQITGVVGTVTCLYLFFRSPSFPTPDKLLIFLAFIFMVFKQLLPMLRRLLPFVLIILTYESFRSFADKVNTHISYTLAPHFDMALFGKLPTVYFQNLLWKGHVQWYDFVFYIAYMMHFIIPLGLAILIWKTREKQYWRVVNTYLVCAFAAFITFFILPAAPPWMASENHYIQPVIRISSDVWYSLGLHDFPSVYNKLSPNPVAAIPSLHAAWATLLVLFIYRLYGKRWALLVSIYPFLIYIGTIYQGEHYAFDVLSGILYAILSYKLTPYFMKKFVKPTRKVKRFGAKTLARLPA